MTCGKFHTQRDELHLWTVSVSECRSGGVLVFCGDFCPDVNADRLVSDVPGIRLIKVLVCEEPRESPRCRDQSDGLKQAFVLLSHQGIAAPAPGGTL